MEYIAHYGNLKPGIVLVIDGSGSREEDRPLFNVKEEHHLQMINHINFAGREVISAYWFDGSVANRLGSLVNISICLVRLPPSREVFLEESQKINNVGGVVVGPPLASHVLS